MTTPHLLIRYTNELMTLTSDLDQAAAAAFVERVLGAGREVAAADTFDSARHLYPTRDENEAAIRRLTARLLTAGVPQSEIDRLLHGEESGPVGPEPT